MGLEIAKGEKGYYFVPDHVLAQTQTHHQYVLVVGGAPPCILDSNYFHGPAEAELGVSKDAGVAGVGGIWAS